MVQPSSEDSDRRLLELELAALQLKYAKSVSDRDSLQEKIENSDFQLQKIMGSSLEELGRHELNDLYSQTKKAYWRIKTARAEARYFLIIGD